MPAPTASFCFLVRQNSVAGVRTSFWEAAAMVVAGVVLLMAASLVTMLGLMTP